MTIQCLFQWSNTGIHKLLGQGPKWTLLKCHSLHKHTFSRTPCQCTTDSKGFPDLENTKVIHEVNTRDTFFKYDNHLIIIEVIDGENNSQESYWFHMVYTLFFSMYIITLNNIYETIFFDSFEQVHFIWCGSLKHCWIKHELYINLINSYNYIY